MTNWPRGAAWWGGVDFACSRCFFSFFFSRHASFLPQSKDMHTAKLAAPNCSQVWLVQTVARKALIENGYTVSASVSCFCPQSNCSNSSPVNPRRTLTLVSTAKAHQCLCPVCSYFFSLPAVQQQKQRLPPEDDSRVCRKPTKGGLVEEMKQRHEYAGSSFIYLFFFFFFIWQMILREEREN